MATQLSNATSSYFARETSPKVVSASANWLQVEEDANSAAEVGADYTLEAVEVFGIDQQNQRGVLVDKDATGGVNTYLNLPTDRFFMQGFLRANIDEAATTKPLNGTQVALTNIDGTNDEFEAASGLDVFKVNDIILGVNNTNAANDGIKVVTSASATAVGVAESLTDDTPSSSTYIKVVGFQFPSGDVDVVASSSQVAFNTTTTDCTTLDIQVGQIVYWGGDSAGLTFVTNDGGFARVASISTNSIVCDLTTWTAANETGTGLTVQLFFDTAIRNKTAQADIVDITYQQEMYVGEDGDGSMYNYITGLIPNELNIDMGEATAIKATYGFLGMDEEAQDGTGSQKTGTHTAATPLVAFNTTSHIHTERLYVVDPTDINNAALMGHIKTSGFSISTGAGVNKEHGTLGGFEQKKGNCTVTAEYEGYFEDQAIKTAIAGNLDVGSFTAITGNNNGICIDIPNAGAAGGKINRSNNESIMIPMTINAGKCDNGYTAMVCHFEYLPDAAL